MRLHSNRLSFKKRICVGLLWSAALLIAVSAPMVASDFALRAIEMFFLAAGLALSWNILGGFAGYWSFGHTVFIGIGAFTAGKLAPLIGVQTGIAWLLVLTLGAGGIASSLLALILSYPLLRLRGIYFAIAMLGVAELCGELSSNVNAIGGGLGLMMPSVVPGNVEPAVFFYYLFLAVVALFTGVAAWIKYSRFGYGLISVREDEDTARMLGVPTESYKALSFIISGFMAGILGVVYGYYLGFFTTDSVIRVDFSLNMILYCLIGGIGSLIGPIIGAGIMTFLTQVVLGSLLNVHILITGLLVIGMVLLAPSGIVGEVKKSLIRRSGMLELLAEPVEDRDHSRKA
jgi:branched-chain amino acid transport system permease protein